MKTWHRFIELVFAIQLQAKVAETACMSVANGSSQPHPEWPNWATLLNPKMVPLLWLEGKLIVPFMFVHATVIVLLASSDILM